MHHVLRSNGRGNAIKFLVGQRFPESVYGSFPGDNSRCISLCSTGTPGFAEYDLRLSVDGDRLKRFLGFQPDESEAILSLSTRRDGRKTVSAPSSPERATQILNQPHL